jgi:thiamine-phosphate pyrophosphorylase
MPLNLPKQPRPQLPLLYLITSGKTTAQTTPASKDFANVLELVRAAVAAGIDLVQIREKGLSASVLYQLTLSAAAITRTSPTKLLVNDRSDIAFAGADGVHLTTRSLPTGVVRRAFGAEFLIGVSTHSIAEADAARCGGADFVVFGPIFATSSKTEYSEPVGLASLTQVALGLAPFPVLALGGLEIGNVADCIQAGASGVAAISMFGDPQRLVETVKDVRDRFSC